jgi:ferredoxin
MKLVVDFDKCTGLGMCESIDPDRFEIDDNGKLVLLRAEVEDHELPLVEDAISGCPTEALRLQK